MTDDPRQDAAPPEPTAGDDLRLAPADDRKAWPPSRLLAEAAVREAFDEPAERNQFTLRDMFVLVTFCALLSWPLSHLPRPVFAGAIGGVTVILMIVQTFFEPRHALVRYGWWALLGVYLLACALAVAGV